MDARNADKGDFVDWLLHAYAGTREIHDVTLRHPGETEDALARRCLVAVNERVQAPRLLELEAILHDLWVVPPEVWEQASDGRATLPEGFGRVPARSWSRTSRHEDTTARLNHLVLKNFRRFEQTRVVLHAGVNVLIGQNGAGKTTILDALAMGLAGGVRPLHRDIGDAFSGARLRADDVRVARIEKGGIPTFERQLPARIDVDMLFCGEPMQAGPVAEAFGNGAVASGPGRAVSFLEYTDVVRWAVQDGFDVTLPLVAYYGTGRTWRSGQQRAFGRDDLSRLAGYDGCLDPSTNLSGMRAWFRRMELLALQDGRTPPVLEASKRAVLACMEGCDLVRYDARLDDLAARFVETGLLLGFEQLSDGQRNMLGMVADMAYRASTLNPHLGASAAEQTPGVVLIDEVDLHLHPAWQRRVLHDLSRAFPRLQLIVTTHSPQVLGEVPTDAVIVLADSQPFSPPAPTAGRDSNSILLEVLGVSAHPRETVIELEEIVRLIDDKRYDEARSRLGGLAEKLTDRDPEIRRLESLLDVVERIDETDRQGA